MKQKFKCLPLTKKMLTTSIPEWEDRGTYWVSKYAQGTTQWSALRSCLQLTASQFGKEKVTLPPDCSHQMMMDHGVRTEWEARQWYQESRNVYIRQLGLAIPKWENRIGASLDGEVLGGKGMIEIKCPLRMYSPLKNYVCNEDVKNDDHAKRYPHIWREHFDQMQGCMAICEKEWCDYIVYVPVDRHVFVQRIFFDKEYWEKDLYPRIQVRLY